METGIKAMNIFQMMKRKQCNAEILKTSAENKI